MATRKNSKLTKAQRVTAIEAAHGAKVPRLMEVSGVKSRATLFRWWENPLFVDLVNSETKKIVDRHRGKVAKLFTSSVNILQDELDGECDHTRAQISVARDMLKNTAALAFADGGGAGVSKTETTVTAHVVDVDEEAVDEQIKYYEGIINGGADASTEG